MLSVPSEFAVIRVLHPLITISTTLRSSLTSQTRLLLRLRTSLIGIPPSFSFAYYKEKADTKHSRCKPLNARVGLNSLGSARL